jgi:hypothetical protein
MALIVRISAWMVAAVCCLATGLVLATALSRDLPLYRWAAVVVEISLAVTIVARPLDWRSWCASFVLFLVYGSWHLVAYALAWPLCDCFGPIQLPHLTMFLLNAVIAGGSTAVAYQVRSGNRAVTSHSAS